MKKTFKEVIILFLIILSIFWLAYDLNIKEGKWNNTGMFVLFVICIVILIIFMPNYQEKDWNRLILFAGFFMRIWYTLWTNYMERSHDFGTISLDGNGHGAYIYYIFKKGCLPGTNDYQFYQPPFYHALCAGILKVFSVFHPNDDVITMFQITRVVSCFATCGMLLLTAKICDELVLAARNKYIVLIGTALFPGYFLMSDFGNNDALAYFFMMLILYITILWYKNHNMKNTIALGLAFGFGMMTKTNVAILAFLVGGLMIYKLLVELKQKKAKSLIKEYVVFFIAAFPFGMWYQIRNLIKFHQPLGYVYDVGEDSYLSVKNVSMIKRFLPVDWKNFFSPLYISVSNEKNIFKCIAKSAVFGEFSFSCPKIAAILLILFNILLMILSVVAMGYMLFKKLSERKKKITDTSNKRLVSYLIVILFIMWFISYIIFNFKYPYSCTMNFRYIAMMPLLGYMAIAYMEQEFASKNTKWGKTVSVFIWGVIGIFSALSIYSFSVI